ncbi:unnamed protein product [Clavelina lepadiformis]|uniref:Cell cycle control protein n=1 Tax=Clavelina lepadiformis TaxID=159417 RepID=A0ABP0GUX7_CLALP
MSRKPENTAFKQQRIPAWHPLLTAKSVFPTFLVVSVAFIPIGVVLLVNSQNIIEIMHDYTDCTSVEDNSVLCSSVRLNQSRMEETCTCQINVSFDTSMSGDVFMYYGLTNFFQNHRRYVKSRDDNQLIGQHVTQSTVSSECLPFAYLPNGTVFAPCGAIANSLFNDSFTMIRDTTVVPFLQTGIAWPTDYSQKFNNPSPVNDLSQAFSSYIRPLFWQRNVEDLDTVTSNSGYQNEGLIVWMRAAAFSHFRKPYGRLDRSSSEFENGLSVGNYIINVSYNYPVTAFGGHKRFILSTTNWMGGKNNFLGIAYITFGCVCMCIGVLLCCLHYHARKRHVVHVDK